MWALPEHAYSRERGGIPSWPHPSGFDVCACAGVSLSVCMCVQVTCVCMHACVWVCLRVVSLCVRGGCLCVQVCLRVCRCVSVCAHNAPSTPVLQKPSAGLRDLLTNVSDRRGPSTSKWRYDSWLLSWEAPPMPPLLEAVGGDRCRPAATRLCRHGHTSEREPSRWAWSGQCPEIVTQAVCHAGKSWEGVGPAHMDSPPS